MISRANLKILDLMNSLMLEVLVYLTQMCLQIVCYSESYCQHLHLCSLYDREDSEYILTFPIRHWILCMRIVEITAIRLAAML